MKLVEFTYHDCIFEITEEQESLLRYIKRHGINADDIEIIDTNDVPKLKDEF